MSYGVEFRQEAVDRLRHLDKAVAQRILRRLRWLSDNLDTVTPEVLTAELKGLFKLRVGSYRVIYEINRRERLIIVHLVGHRRDIYKKK